MGFDVRRGRTGEHNRLVRIVAARAHAAADSGTRPASNAPRGHRAPPAAVRMGGGAASARPQLPHAHVARGDELAVALALLRAARTGRARSARPRGAMAAHRMAKERAQTRPLLAVHSAPRHSNEEPGGHRHGSMAHRAGLSGTEIRAGLAPLRRTQLAWLPSSWESM